MLSRDRCSRPRCKGKAWASQIRGSPISLRHTEEIFRREEIPVLFNRNTYICERNKMHIDGMVANFRSLRAHNRDCPRECDVNSCPHLEGIRRTL